MLSSVYHPSLSVCSLVPYLVPGQLQKLRLGLSLFPTTLPAPSHCSDCLLTLVMCVDVAYKKWWSTPQSLWDLCSTHPEPTDSLLNFLIFVLCP